MGASESGHGGWSVPPLGSARGCTGRRHRFKLLRFVRMLIRVIQLVGPGPDRNLL